MIELSNVYKRFASHEVLKGISLEIADGEMLALIGRSGLGKSVLLKHIVGLLRPDSGGIMVAGQDISRLRGKRLERMRRRFGYLFQDGALFDSLTIADNVAFPLREKTRTPEREIRDRVVEELTHMGLERDLRKYPAQLSGGMRKRAALARALIMRPSIMLFDEPTTGLDPIIGQSILHYIRDCHERIGFTGIIVSHDVPRVFSAVQRIALLHDGRVIVHGTPHEVAAMADPMYEQFIAGRLDGPLHYV